MLEGVKFPQSRMIKIILNILFILFIFNATAQRTKTTELKPINPRNGRCYYDFRKTEGAAYRLKVALQSPGDEEVKIRYKKFKGLRFIEGAVSFVPLVLLLPMVLPDYKTF